LPQHRTQFILFKTEGDKISVDVRIESETVWLTQAHLAELFQTSRPNITMHIKNILEDGELQEVSVCKDFLHTAADGKNYNTKYYNLDMIISLGYRINSKIATQFRQWATAYQQIRCQREKIFCQICGNRHCESRRKKQGQEIFNKQKVAPFPI
jgi:hypothetical protein